MVKKIAPIASQCISGTEVNGGPFKPFAVPEGKGKRVDSNLRCVTSLHTRLMLSLVLLSVV